MNGRPRIAYFSMEIGVLPEMPTYSGGLGVLAGDTIRAAADLGIPLVAVTLLHRTGYFYQRLDPTGWQIEEPVAWPVDNFLSDTGTRASVSIEGRTVTVRAWLYKVIGNTGKLVPVYFLDTDLPENSAWDRRLTDMLYGGDAHYRLCQEVVLGIGGVRMLEALGLGEIERYHMNEGHSSLLTLELLRRRLKGESRKAPSPEDMAAVHDRCVFTTHTPVASAHDQYPLELAERVLGPQPAWCVRETICHEGRLNMTYLALTLSHYVNGVAKRHGEVSQHMFGSHKIDSITNGVHGTTWVSEALGQLYDLRIPGWRADSSSFRYALGIPADEIWNAHRATKRVLMDYANRTTNAGFDMDVFTIAFARRATAYKRPGLLFANLQRLRDISNEVGRLQILYAGKAHPSDDEGKRHIQRITQVARELAPDVRIGFLPNYDMNLAGLMTAGADLWLNTPERPLEASGTSGMKAALNGIPSLSVLDGWWLEGCIEGVTGWAIGGDTRGTTSDWSADAESLYTKLEHAIVPMFYNERNRYIDVMRHAIALNGSFFNTQRMVQEYVTKAYFE
jgi:glycogen phosphorylase